MKEREYIMETIIKVNHLTKKFEDFYAVRDISFEVQRGELFGFLGVNGAGKSTTINMLCTLLKPTEGTAEIAGAGLGVEDEIIKRHIGVVSQGNVLDSLLSVKENLICRGSLYEPDKRILQRKLNEVIEILMLEDVLKRPYGKLSGGQKRRSEIAAALMHTPDVLFLDEPTTGLDPATRQSVWQAIENLQKEWKMTVFLTTHYMEEAAKSNHIAMIDKGKLIEYGTPFSLKERFAQDRLILTAEPSHWEALQKMLQGSQLIYHQTEDKFEVSIPDTKSAIPIVDRVQEIISGFEVIQGTMDDVFLNVTHTTCQ